MINDKYQGKHEFEAPARRGKARSAGSIGNELTGGDEEHKLHKARLLNRRKRDADKCRVARPVGAAEFKLSKLRGASDW